MTFSWVIPILSVVIRHQLILSVLFVVCSISLLSVRPLFSPFDCPLLAQVLFLFFYRSAVEKLGLKML